MSNEGWIGNHGQIQHYLRTVGADRDEEGRFYISEPGIMTGITGDAIVPADTKYFVNGKPASLVFGLRSTSYGLGITVITG